MKKIAAIILAIAMLLSAAGCNAKSSQAMEQVKPTIPYGDRLFIYNNGLDIEYEQLEVTDEDKSETFSYYPVISGLKNKEIQDKLNREIPAMLDDMLIQLQTKYSEGKDIESRFRRKNKDAHISYNCNNVIFINFNVGFTADLAGGGRDHMNSRRGVGYDLNTGDKIKLADLFKPGVDYKKMINAYISQYIIENNYDDYEYEVMTKPFQGIREDQSYILNAEGLVINMDEKNDDFFYYGYPLSIPIPLEYFGDELYIFDRYFDEDVNIFEKDRLTRKLLPNKIRFIPKNYLEEGGDRWSMSIMQGGFINIPDKAVEKEINAMLAPVLDAGKFREEAEEYMKKGNPKHFWHYTHSIDVPINAGGYLSVISFDEVVKDKDYQLYRRVFNYDFNQKRKMKLTDLFINDIDIQAIIKRNIRKADYPITEEMLEQGVKAAIESDEFSFSERYIVLRFDPEGANLGSHQQWIWIDFEEFGLENISILNE